MRSVPVPYEALDLVTPAEYGAVLDLYKRGHSLQWKPFRVKTRSLMVSWGMSSRGVWSLLELFAEAGLLDMVKGSNVKPSIITMHCPAKVVAE